LISAAAKMLTASLRHQRTVVIRFGHLSDKRFS
jgi:hypothetical protein